MKKQKTNISHRIAASFTVGVMGVIGTSSDASAGGLGTIADFDNLTNSMTEATNNFTTFLNLFAYVGGSAFGILGIMKLKQHVDNPGQAPLKDGLMRLAAGGGLLALPVMTRIAQGVIADGSTGQLTVNPLADFAGATGG